MEATCNSPSPRPSPRVLGEGVLLAAAFVAMLVWTWLKWPDPLIDFGRELYLSWRVSEGTVLYRDIEHFNGPLSVWFNAILFRVFGASVHTLMFANIAICAAIIALIYLLMRQAGDRFSAVMCCLVFITLFACAQFVDVGNYNFITPYSHELTHGILLSLGAIGIAATFARWQQAYILRGAGALLGLLWLTKIEVFLAGAGACLVGTMLAPASARRWRRALELVAPAVAIVLIVFCLNLIALPAADALRAVLGSAYHLFDSQVASLRFYRINAGLDDPGRNIIAMLVSAGVMGGLIAIARFMPRGGHGWSISLALLLSAGAPVVAIAAGSTFPWPLAFRGLPIVIAGALLFEMGRARRETPSPSRMVWIMWLVFSLLLLTKIMLAARIEHYGFALAMPATLALVAMLAAPRTSRAEARREPRPPREAGPPHEPCPPRDPRIGRVFAVSIVLTVIAVHLNYYRAAFAYQPVQIGVGGDSFRSALPRGEALAMMLGQIEAIVPQDATLAAVPEGAMINFLSRRRNPTPFVTLLPPEFAMFGGDRIVAAYKANPPDFIVVVPTDVSQYGSAGFARDYGAEVARWIDKNYRDVPTPAHPAYRMTLMRRR